MNNTWDNLLDPHALARGSSKSATAGTAQDISPTPLPITYANELKVGTKVVVEAIGEMTTSGTPPTFLFGLWYGAVGTGWLQVAFTPTASLTSAEWHFRFNGLVTAVGATGAIYGAGIIDIPSSITAYATSANAGGFAIPGTAAGRSLTVDTTVAKNWGLQLTTSAATAGNSVICDILNLQILNQGKT